MPLILASTVFTTGVAFCAGALLTAGLAWRRFEALTMDNRTLETQLDTFRERDVQSWLDDIGPVTPPSGLGTVPGLPMIGDDTTPDTTT